MNSEERFRKDLLDDVSMDFYNFCFSADSRSKIEHYKGALGDNLKKCSKWELKKKVVDFYNKWYTPENVSLVVVGEFSDEQTKQDVLEYANLVFSAIPTASERNDNRLNQNPVDLRIGTVFRHLADSQIINPQINIICIPSKNPLKTFSKGSGLNSLLNYAEEFLFSEIINHRFRQLITADDSPITEAEIKIRNEPLTQSSVAYISIMPQVEKITQAFRLVLTEIKRIQQWGVHDSELKQSVNKLVWENQQLSSHLNLLSHDMLIRSYVNRIVFKKHPRDIKTRTEMRLDFYRKLTPERIAFTASRVFKIFEQDPANMFVHFLTHAPMPVEYENVIEDLKQTYDEVNGIKEIPNCDEVINSDDWLPERPSPAPVTQRSLLKAIDGEEIHFSNGHKLNLKHVNDPLGRIALSFVYPKGLKHFSHEDGLALSTSISILNDCGLADQSSKTVNAKLRSSLISNFTVNLTSAGWEVNLCINNMEHLELALQLMYLRFTDLRVIDSKEFESIWNSTLNGTKEATEREEQTEDGLYRKTIQQLLYGSQKIFKAYSSQDYESLNLKAGQEHLTNMLSNLKGGTFTLYGPFSTEDVLPLVQSYIGGLPSLPESTETIITPWKEVAFPDHKVEEVSYFGEDPELSRVLYYVPIQFSSDKIKNLHRSYAASIIDQYLFQMVRRSKQECYQVDTRLISSRLDLTMEYLRVNIESPIAQQSSLKQSIESALNEALDLSADELQRRLSIIKQNSEKEKIQNRDSTGYWGEYINGFVAEGTDLQMIKLLDVAESQISVDDIRGCFDEIRKGWEVRKILTVHPKIS